MEKLSKKGYLKSNNLGKDCFGKKFSIKVKVGYLLKPLLWVKGFYTPWLC